MKSYQLAAAVLSALTTTAAFAEVQIVDTYNIDNIKSKTMCIPVAKYDGNIEIMALCDASTVNTAEKLKINAAGCAVVGQSLDADGNGEVYEQAVMKIWGTEAEIKTQSIPECEKFDAASYWIEL